MSEKYFGKYRAMVVSTDDPLFRGRILVKSVSLMANKGELGWAEPCFPHGVFSLPYKGEHVWVEFEQGDITLPIWTGVIRSTKYTKGTLFAEFPAHEKYDPNIRMFNDDFGNKVYMHEGDKLGDVKTVIKDVGNNVMTFDHKNKKVTLDFVTYSLEIDKESGDFTYRGKNGEVIKGSAGELEVSSPLKVKVTAPKVDLGGEVNVTGSVNIGGSINISGSGSLGGSGIMTY